MARPRPHRHAADEGHDRNVDRRGAPVWRLGNGGGAPVTKKHADTIRVSAYTEKALLAVQPARELMGRGAWHGSSGLDRNVPNGQGRWSGRR